MLSNEEALTERELAEEKEADERETTTLDTPISKNGSTVRQRSNKELPKSSPSSKGAPSRRPGKQQPTFDQVVACFAACGRCSYFWAGCQLTYGADNLQSVVDNSQAGWLTLAWNPQMRQLVHKSYGSRIDIDCYHYEGCCSVCCRHFIFRESNGSKQSPTFRVELKPRRRDA